MRHCKTCGQDKNEAEFNRRLDGYQAKCRACDSAWHKKRYQKNKEYYKEKALRYHKENREHQLASMAEWRKRNPSYWYTWKGAEGSFSEEEWVILCERFGNVCLCCLKAKPLIPDHIVPVLKGGRNDIHNIQPLCDGCNKSKGQLVTDYRF